MLNLEYKKQNYLKLGEQPLSGSSMINWIRLLKDNKFSIDLQFIPKAIYVTAMIAALSPFRMIEKRQFDNKIKNINHIKPIFIIGHFRSGTTFLHYLLGQDPNIGFVSTFETMTPGLIINKEEFFRNLVKNHLPAKRPMDDLEMHANLPYEEEYAIANLSQYSFYHGWYFPRNWKQYFDKYVLFDNLSNSQIEAWKKTYDYFIKKIAYKNDGKFILLKSIVNTAKIKEILDLYPNARFIHIHRDPYKVYMSTWKLYQSILPLFSFQHITKETLDELILYCYHNLFKKYLKQKSMIPKNQLVEIGYDTFIRDPVATIEKTYNELNISHFSEAKKYFKTYAYQHRNYQASSYNINKQLKDKIYRNWKFMFDAYHYPI
jgi:omega-hydroxy-beta-dihydromenaquinone-9 sulfotransferase